MRKPTKLLMQTWKLIRDVHVELVWIRTHLGTEGNERRMWTNSQRKQQRARMPVHLWHARSCPRKQSSVKRERWKNARNTKDTSHLIQ
ncbi:hypothetical protein Trydic_g12227 [Trypoxylus dichotomus]